MRYKGTKTVAVTPDYSEVAKLADLWLHPKQGTDAALAMAMGHVALNEFYFGGSAGPLPSSHTPTGGGTPQSGGPGGPRQRSAYFDDYARRYTDLPLLVMLEEGARWPTAARSSRPAATCARATSTASSARRTTRSGRRVAFDTAGRAVLPNGSIGFRWGAEGRDDVGKWNLEAKEARHDGEVKLKLSVLEDGEGLEPTSA